MGVTGRPVVVTGGAGFHWSRVVRCWSGRSILGSAAGGGERVEPVDRAGGEGDQPGRDPRAAGVGRRVGAVRRRSAHRRPRPTTPSGAPATTSSAGHTGGTTTRSPSSRCSAPAPTPNATPTDATSAWSASSPQWKLWSSPADALLRTPSRHPVPGGVVAVESAPWRSRGVLRSAWW